MQDVSLFVGVDVSKAELVIATEPGAGQLTVPNEAKAIARWLRGLNPQACLAMESTGRYHQLLARLALEAGRRVYVINAKDIYFYAKGLGARGKTDASDARVIVRYVQEHQARLRPAALGTPEQSRLSELLRRRATISRHLGAVEESLKDVPDLARLRASLVLQTKRLLASLDAKIQSLIDADPVMRVKREQLLSVPGVGPQVSALLTALLSRIPFANADAVVAYSGLDPRPNDSGLKRGRRTLSKRGPASMRRLMWLAAFSASHSRAFAGVYQAIRSRGFSSTEAVVILARKLLRIAWAIWRTGVPFDLSKVKPAT